MSRWTTFAVLPIFPQAASARKSPITSPQRGHRVALLIGESATYPGERRAQAVKVFSTTADLRAKLKALSATKVDAIFHAAAVSDFGFGQVFIGNEHRQIYRAQGLPRKSPRAPARCSWNWCSTPKIIAELRGWYPHTRLIGWKFEADGGRADALRAAIAKTARGLRHGFLRGQRPRLWQRLLAGLSQRK